MLYVYIFSKQAITSSTYSSALCVACLLGKVRVDNADANVVDDNNKLFTFELGLALLELLVVILLTELSGEAADKVADEESLDDGAFLDNINNGALELVPDGEGVNKDVLLLLLTLLPLELVVFVLLIAVAAVIAAVFTFVFVLLLL